MLRDAIASIDQSDWLTTYKASNAQRLKGDPQFAEWLDTEYVPIAGGWQY
jgi:hypothetical protein